MSEDSGSIAAAGKLATGPSFTAISVRPVTPETLARRAAAMKADQARDFLEAFAISPAPTGDQELFQDIREAIPFIHHDIGDIRDLSDDIFQIISDWGTYGNPSERWGPFQRKWVQLMRVNLGKYGNLTAADSWHAFFGTGVSWFSLCHGTTRPFALDRIFSQGEEVLYGHGASIEGDTEGVIRALGNGSYWVGIEGDERYYLPSIVDYGTWIFPAWAVTQLASRYMDTAFRLRVLYRSTPEEWKGQWDTVLTNQLYDKPVEYTDRKKVTRILHFSSRFVNPVTFDSNRLQVTDVPAFQWPMLADTPFLGWDLGQIPVYPTDESFMQMCWGTYRYTAAGQEVYIGPRLGVLAQLYALGMLTSYQADEFFRTLKEKDAAAGQKVIDLCYARRRELGDKLRERSAAMFRNFRAQEEKSNEIAYERAHFFENIIATIVKAVILGCLAIVAGTALAALWSEASAAIGLGQLGTAGDVVVEAGEDVVKDIVSDIGAGRPIDVAAPVPSVPRAIDAVEGIAGDVGLNFGGGGDSDMDLNFFGQNVTIDVDPGKIFDAAGQAIGSAFGGGAVLPEVPKGVTDVVGAIGSGVTVSPQVPTGTPGTAAGQGGAAQPAAGSTGVVSQAFSKGQLTAGLMAAGLVAILIYAGSRK